MQGTTLTLARLAELQRLIDEVEPWRAWRGRVTPTLSDCVPDDSGYLLEVDRWLADLVDGGPRWRLIARPDVWALLRAELRVDDQTLAAMLAHRIHGPYGAAKVRAGAAVERWEGGLVSGPGVLDMSGS